MTLHPFSSHAAAGRAHLRILGTTDLHVHVYPYDYFSDFLIDTAGLSRTASVIEATRSEATNTLLVDNGDILQGNPMGDYIANERGMKDGDTHPIVRAMNALRFDAATIGNHEFNYGLDFLMKSMQGADFPVVLANIAREQGADARGDRTLFAPYVLLDRVLTDGAGNRHPIRVGVIGFTPPQVMVWDRTHLEGRVRARDIVATAEALVPQMRDEGADLVLALSHSGIGPAQRTDGMENAAVPLAAVDGIDAVVTGHSHLVFPSQAYAGCAGVDAEAGTISGKPAVMSGLWGSHLGLIDLLLERHEGAWRIMSARTEARPIFEREPDRTVVPLVDDNAAVLDAARGEHAETLAYVRRPVGRTATPLHSYFSLVAGDASLRIVATAQQTYVARMLQNGPYDGLPLLSAVAPFKAGGRGGPGHYTDVPAGDVAIRNMADLYLFPNSLRAVKVTGAQLRGWLERSVSLFNRVTPGARDAPLLDPAFPGYYFDVIEGVTYVIDLSQPARFNSDGVVQHPDARRITALAFQGRPVTDEMQFIVATNDYRASGGGAFPGAGGDTIVLEAPDTNRDVVIQHFLERSVVDVSKEPCWSFAPMPGTTVVFPTGPGARAHAADVRGVQLEDAGDAPDGFALFRITL